jgi:transcriptional regulator with XRE-family HTH domain
MLIANPATMARHKPSRGLLVTIASNVRRFRKARTWSQGDLAKSLKVHPSLIARIEQARANVTVGTIEHIAKALGVAPRDLL